MKNWKQIFESTLDNTLIKDSVSEILDKAYALKRRGINVSKYLKSESHDAYYDSLYTNDISTFCESVLYRQNRLIKKILVENDDIPWDKLGRDLEDIENAFKPSPAKSLDNDDSIGYNSRPTRRSGSGSSDIRDFGKERRERPITPTRRSGSGSSDIRDFGKEQKQKQDKVDAIATYVRHAYMQQLEPMFQKFISDIQNKYPKNTPEFRNHFVVAHKLHDQLKKAINSWQPKAAREGEQAYQGHKQALDSFIKPKIEKKPRKGFLSQVQSLFSSQAKKRR